MNIYWVTITKISVCEGCEGCTTRKSGPGWRSVREPRVWPCVALRVPADRSPRYTNLSQVKAAPKSQLNAPVHAGTHVRGSRMVKNAKIFSALRAEVPS
mgnify:CR=1 FL=1